MILDCIRDGRAWLRAHAHMQSCTCLGQGEKAWEVGEREPVRANSRQLRALVCGGIRWVNVCATVVILTFQPKRSFWTRRGFSLKGAKVEPPLLYTWSNYLMLLLLNYLMRWHACMMALPVISTSVERKHVESAR